jgi:serine/threonine-protein kinase HipA
MRRGKVLYNNIPAGILTETNEGEYIFHYDDEYFFNKDLPPVSVTLPKSRQIHRSNMLFPFFFNMISEGVNRKLQSRILKIDEADDFGLLLKTAAHETIGAITVEEIND